MPLPPGDIRSTPEYVLLDKLWFCDPADQRRAHALGVSNMDDDTLENLLKMFREDNATTLGRSVALDNKASSILAVLGLFGTLFLSSNSPVFARLSSHVVQVSAACLVLLFVLVMYFSWKATRVYSFYAPFDGYALNVTPRDPTQVFGHDYNATAMVHDDALLKLTVSTAFDKSGYLRKNVLNVAQINAMNRAVNLEKAKWLKFAQWTFVALLGIVVILAVYLACLSLWYPLPRS